MLTQDYSDAVLHQEPASGHGQGPCLMQLSPFASPALELTVALMSDSLSYATEPLAGCRPLVVDHYDSYTGSLVHLVAQVTGEKPAVAQHDDLEIDEVSRGGYTHLILSPGPGHPDEPGDFSIGRELLTHSTVPVLGVCLEERHTYVGWARHGNPSLTFDAGTRTVREHRGQQETVVGDDIFEVLDERLGRDSRPTIELPLAFTGGWVGYFGYACRTDLPSLKNASGDAAPDACLIQVERFLAFDHHRQTLHAVSLDDDPRIWLAEMTGLLATPGTSTVAAEEQGAWQIRDFTLDDYAAAFQRVREALLDGDTYETNLTYRLLIGSPVRPLTLLRNLRALGPTPYASLFRHDELSVVSASPERFVLIGRDRMLESRRIKGTLPRGDDEADDTAFRNSLLTEAKFIAETSLSLISFDMTFQWCVPRAPSMCLHSWRSRAIPTCTSSSPRSGGVVVAGLSPPRAFPAASMTGAPKRRTMELIEAVESSPRGVYSGALGWIGFDGRADLGVVIRSIVMVHDRFLLGTGGAVTVHSNPDTEYRETRCKIGHLLYALFGQQRGTVLSPTEGIARSTSTGLR
jgi:para-aminobenzoate synthetase